MSTIKQWLGGISIVLIVFAAGVMVYRNVQLKKTKKILIIYGDGGASHKMAAQSITQLLADTEFSTEQVNLFETMGASIDPVAIFTRGRVTGEEIYNKTLRKGWTELINRYVKIFGPIMARMHNKRLPALATEYFKQVQPDLIISVVPLINKAAIQAAQTLGIPYILITLDLDLTCWLIDFTTPELYKNFYLSIWHDALTLRQACIQRCIANERIVCLGFPLRQQFFTPKDVPALKYAYQIPVDKPVIMLMMGGAGSDIVYTYVKKIHALATNAHIIACVGNNTQLIKKLTHFQEKTGCSLTILGFVEQLADIMACADLLITKPGPGTINEAIQMHLPLLLDATGVPLFWEKPHIDFVTAYGFGDAFSSMEELEAGIKKYLMLSPVLRTAMYAHKDAVATIMTKEALLHLIHTTLSHK